MRSRLSTISFAIVLALVAVLAMATLAGAATSIPANFDSSVMPGNEAEDAIAVNPTNASDVVTMATLPGVPAGLSVNVTSNAGRTWAHRVIGATASDPLGAICCDQQLAWDRFGNLWMTYLVNTDGDVLVALSTDGGNSFTQVGDLKTKFGDQPSIATGSNSVWISFTASPGSQIEAFGAPVTGLGQFESFTAPEVVPSPGGNGDYGDTAVGPGGVRAPLLLTYQKATNGQGGSDIYTAVDPDGLGPLGFNTPTLVAHSHVGGFDFIPAQPDRSIDDEANLAWDRSGGPHNGRAYLVWTQETPGETDDTDIMLQHSDDNGATWSPAVKLNDDQTANSQYDPSIALDQATGNLALSWYDTRNDLGTGGSGDTNGVPNDDFQIWATYSTDGGTSFARNFQVSRGTSNAVDANTGFDVGDYTHAAFAGGMFWPAWSDNSNSTGNNPDGTLHQFDLYTAKIAIP